jgi:MFS family permease
MTRQSLWAISVGIVAAVYLLQAATPLRLDDDSVDYLRMAAAMTDHRIVPALPLPIGYPVILSALERAGLGSSTYFVLANCLFLGLGLYAVWGLLADYPAKVRNATVLLTLLAFPVVKSVAIALPEAAFFGVSLLAIRMISAGAAALSSKRGFLLAMAFVSVAAAIGIRTIGVALLPSLTWVCVSSGVARDREKQQSRARAWVLMTLLVAVAILAAVVRSEPFFAYQDWLRGYYLQADVARQIGKRIVVVLWGWGEIVLNLPFSRFREMQLGFVAVGIASLIALGIAVRKVRRPLTPVRLYLLTYGLVIAVWPNPSPRLWMPVIPLLIAEIGLLVSRLPNMRWKTALVGAYSVWFALTGITAIAYTTRISLSGANFQKVYGRNGGMPTAEVDPSNPNWGHIQYYKAEARRMIERYDRHGAERK